MVLKMHNKIGKGIDHLSENFINDTENKRTQSELNNTLTEIYIIQLYILEGFNSIFGDAEE